MLDSKVKVPVHRALLVGLGSMGQRDLDLLDDVVPKTGLYLCDTSPSRLAGVMCADSSTDLRELLSIIDNDGGPDIVIVASPASTHLDVLADVLELAPLAGVLVEKPLVNGALCDHPRLDIFGPVVFTRCIAVGYNWRYHPMVERVSRFADQIVDVTLYVADEMNNWPGDYGDWLSEFSHELDIVRVWTRDPTVESVTMTGDGAVIRGFHRQGRWTVIVRPHHLPKGRWVRLRMADGGRVSYAWDTSQIEDTYRDQLHDFVKAWSTSGRPQSLRCSLADGMATAELLDECHLALSDGLE
jgi:predicted dehydrogenase